VEFVRTYFGSAPEWAAARAARGRPIRDIVRSLRQLPREGSSIPADRRRYVTDLGRTLAYGVFADRRLLLRYAMRVWAAKLRYRLSRTDAQRFRAFEAFYVADTSLARVRFALRESEDDQAHGQRQLSCLVASIDDADLYGFSNLEHFDGQPFRWSSATAAVRLCLEPADYVATIQLVGVRLIDPGVELAVFVGTCRVSCVRFDRSTWQLTFRVAAAALEAPSPRWLIIHKRPWQHPAPAPAEDRGLGLPIASLSFRRQEDHKMTAAARGAT